MKVLCIKNGVWSVNGFKDPYGPKFGEIVTATQCPVYKNNYDILEYPLDTDGTPTSYAKKSFIPISNIDETEMIKQREEQLCEL